MKTFHIGKFLIVDVWEFDDFKFPHIYTFGAGFGISIGNFDISFWKGDWWYRKELDNN